jgi:serine/threonine-protein kinase RsbW
VVDVALNLELPRQRRAVAVLRHAVSSLCREIGVEEDDITDLALALSEACNNVVAHAHSDDSFRVTFNLADLTAKVTVANAATPFSAEAFNRGDVGDELSESGRGLMIMRTLVDEARFTPSADGGTLVELVRQVRCAEGSLLADAEQLNGGAAAGGG